MKLLERKPTKRLGMLSGKAADVMRHKWFDGVDWEALAAKRLQPPRKPRVRSGAHAEGLPLAGHAPCEQRGRARTCRRACTLTHPRAPLNQHMPTPSFPLVGDGQRQAPQGADREREEGRGAADKGVAGGAAGVRGRVWRLLTRPRAPCGVRGAPGGGRGSSGARRCALRRQQPLRLLGRSGGGAAAPLASLCITRAPSRPALAQRTQLAGACLVQAPGGCGGISRPGAGHGGRHAGWPSLHRAQPAGASGPRPACACAPLNPPASVRRSISLSRYSHGVFPPNA